MDGGLPLDGVVINNLENCIRDVVSNNQEPEEDGWNIRVSVFQFFSVSVFQSSKVLNLLVLAEDGPCFKLKEFTLIDKLEK